MVLPVSPPAMFTDDVAVSVPLPSPAKAVPAMSLAGVIKVVASANAFSAAGSAGEPGS